MITLRILDKVRWRLEPAWSRDYGKMGFGIAASSNKIPNKWMRRPSHVFRPRCISFTDGCPTGLHSIGQPWPMQLPFGSYVNINICERRSYKGGLAVYSRGNRCRWSRDRAIRAYTATVMNTNVFVRVGSAFANLVDRSFIDPRGGQNNFLFDNAPTKNNPAAILYARSGKYISLDEICIERINCPTFESLHSRLETSLG